MISPAWNIIETRYFATLRIPIVEGRDFGLTDTTEPRPWPSSARGSPDASGPDSRQSENP